MEVVFVAMVALTALAAYVLLNPLQLSFKYDAATKRAAVRIRFYPFDRKIHRAKKGKKGRAMKTTEKVGDDSGEARPGKRRQSLWPIIVEEFGSVRLIVWQVVRFAGRLAKSPDRLCLNVSLSGGLHSPDLTGYLFGFVQALRPCLGRTILVAFEPDFSKDTLEGTMVGGIQLRLLRVMQETMIFLWHVPKVTLVKLIIRLRRRA